MKVYKEGNRKRNDILNEKEKHDYRAIVGQLNWMCTQTRPDISFDVCELSSVFENCKVEDALRLNKVVKKYQSRNVVLSYPRLGHYKGWSIGCYSDASFGNLTKG